MEVKQYFFSVTSLRPSGVFMEEYDGICIILFENKILVLCDFDVVTVSN